MKIKVLGIILIMLVAIIFYLSYKIIDQAVTIDHLQMSVTSLKNREKCLSRLSDEFIIRYKSDDLKLWIKNNLTDMDIYDQGAVWIVNEVGFNFSKSNPKIEY